MTSEDGSATAKAGGAQSATQYVSPERMREYLIELVKVQRARGRPLSSYIGESSATFGPEGLTYEIWDEDKRCSWARSPSVSECYQSAMKELFKHLEQECSESEHREGASIVDGGRHVLDMVYVRAQKWDSEFSQDSTRTLAEVRHRIASIPVVTFREQRERWSAWQEQMRRNMAETCSRGLDIETIRRIRG